MPKSKILKEIQFIKDIACKDKLNHDLLDHCKDLIELESLTDKDNHEIAEKIKKIREDFYKENISHTETLHILTCLVISLPFMLLVWLLIEEFLVKR